jgi:menaquinone-dependent protoporphyrinogen oxidase
MHGATFEIAQAIGRVLARRGLSVEVERLENVHSVDAFSVVVLGSAIYYGQWLESAKELVHDQSFALQARPVWLFSSGPLGEHGYELLEGQTADVTAMRNMTRCVEHRTFAGKLDTAQLSFSEKAVATAFHAPEGDFRDWAAVETFATDIAGQLDARRV